MEFPTAFNYLDTANVVSNIRIQRKYPLEYVMNPNWIDVNLNMNPTTVKCILNIYSIYLKKDY